MRRAPIILSAFALGFLYFSQSSLAQVDYELRAQTKDRVRAVFGNAKLGSFGAPAINDRGAVAFASTIFGQNVEARSNGSVLYQRSKRKRPDVLVQTGASLSNTFIGPVPDGSVGVSGSARAFRIGRDVALNRKNQTAWISEMLYATRNIESGDVTQASSVGSYGLSTKFGNSFRTLEANGFTNFLESLLRTTLSLNQEGNIAYNAIFEITPDKDLAGIAYQGYTARKQDLSFNFSLVATVESPVIGLPYFTTFDSFSDAIIAKNNKIFVVADISDDGDEFDGIWQGNNPNLQPIVVKDTAAPGGGTFASFDGKIGASRKGTTVAFIANVTGGDPRSVFRSGVTGKDIIKIVSAGDIAPTNDLVGALGRFSELELAAVNDRGQIAVLGGVPGSRRGVRSGIWITDRGGNNLEFVVVEGQDLLVDGETKRITRIAFNPVAGFNNKGEVAFTASFSDRTSAVFVASVK